MAADTDSSDVLNPERPSSEEASTLLHTFRVPFDIWEEIFHHCLPNDTFIQPAALTAPLLLCQINRAWRNLALSMASLWSSLSIKISRKGCNPSLELVPTWLGRAAEHPLRISMGLKGRPGIDGHKNAEAALRSIIPFFATWKQIEIKFLLFLDLPALLSIPNVTAPSFESLTLSLPATYEQAAEHLALIFKQSPNLSHLALATELPGRDIPNLKVPFEHLTALELGDLGTPVFSPDNSWEILEQCPKLVSLKIGDMNGEFQRVKLGPPVILQDLKELSVTSSTQGMAHFLDAFSSPSLLSVSFIFAHQFPTQSFMNLLRRSSCALTTLLLTVDLAEEETLEILEACPSLIRLGFCHMYTPLVTSLVLQKLTIGTRGPVCPKLEIIAFQGACMASSEGEWAAMLESRYPGMPSDSQTLLQRVYIDGTFLSLLYPDDIARLKKLERQGLRRGTILSIPEGAFDPEFMS
ncbi:hypothetical protein Hypma_009066 [Hypsizygus marmoreus]|uniref:F-box domain-containing protein n=1 Tax=Hypsizygus marmoreus TaxID=39966 RepID=A0A369JTJ6_HYPMA|nr:hypothetical protein Hypma_009066 [Hypsizygus marmoreus]